MLDIVQKYLIIETVEQQLTDAINNHQRVTLHYKGYKGATDKNGKVHGKQKDFTDPGMRIVLPVALGLEKHSGAMVVRALVTSAGVHTKGRKRPTKWRLFRVDRITSVIPREGPNDLNNEMPELFNDQGDEQMSVVYAHANFGDKGQQQDVESEPGEEPIPLQPAPTAPIATSSKIDNIPTGSKVVLKPETPGTKEKSVPQKAEPKPINPVVPQPAPQPIKPEEPKIPAPEDEPDEDALLGLSEDIAKPLKEWFARMNKVLN